MFLFPNAADVHLRQHMMFVTVQKALQMMFRHDKAGAASASLYVGLH